MAGLSPAMEASCCFVQPWIPGLMPGMTGEEIMRV